jgi:hypothetical protein
MENEERRARIVHTISGRLRLRFEGNDPLDDVTGPAKSLGMLRTVSGVLGTDLKPAARSAVVRYDPTVLDERTVLAELAAHGIVVVEDERAAAPPSTGKYEGSTPSPQPSPSGSGSAATSGQTGRQADPKDGERSALMEALIGPPPKLDRRFAESLGLSAVSLLAARRVGLALGGGTTLPAYFVIWFALRRLTGAGRRR